MNKPTIREWQKCDGLCVTILPFDDEGNLWAGVSQQTGGIYWPAGHIDEFRGSAPAAKGELSEEMGFSARHLKKLNSEMIWTPNNCQREYSFKKRGHWWDLYQALVDGTPRLESRAFKSARLFTPAELRSLGDRTLCSLHGQTSGYTRRLGQDGEFIDPLWLLFLSEAGLIDLNEEDLELVMLVVANSERLPAGSPGAPDPGRPDARAGGPR
ncbi:NUDIX domain-containing protein [Spirillospora sp. CA-142024]|uniref:NUDIX domain-containing protein n=1 Tax=Spirillospora sp. CA-142024 TaxID=3240036 RepID=UPI003D905913